MRLLEAIDTRRDAAYRKRLFKYLGVHDYIQADPNTKAYALGFVNQYAERDATIHALKGWHPLRVRRAVRAKTISWTEFDQVKNNFVGSDRGVDATLRNGRLSTKFLEGVKHAKTATNLP